ncbi:MAG: hypothetical protein COB02_10035 [Candidatus Cloacimonadota bacterium]|nr:MAG: hypothetical protein COB02_10035 [Candidatus Cloacimonadota bacterium]
MTNSLSKLQIESDEAHFQNIDNSPLKLIQSPKKLPEYEEIVKFITKVLSNLDKWIHSFQKNKIQFDDRFAFTIYKALLSEISEYVQLSKEKNSKLGRDKIKSFLTLLKTLDNGQHLLSGAKLTMLLESQDAITNKDLYYLANPKKVKAPHLGPLQSYSEMVVWETLHLIETDYTDKKNRADHK